MRLLSAERGGDPDRPGKKNPLDPMLWMAAREGEPSWDGGSLGPRPARLAHRVRRHRPRPPGHGLRRPGRRLRPGLPAPRDGRLARAGADRRVPDGQGVRPRRHGRAATARRCRSPRATSSSSPRCGATGSTRPRSGSRCSRTTTGPTGSGRTRSSTRPWRGWSAGAPPCPGPTGRPPTRSSRRSARPSPNDLDAPAALAAVDRWAALQARAGRYGRGGARALVSRAVDALLGVAL